MSKKCPVCRSERLRETRDGCVGDEVLYRCRDCDNVMEEDELEDVTVFDRITQSPEVLAPCFIEKQPDQWDDDDYAYYSYLTKEWYATEDKALAATVAKLKEVAE